MIGRWMSLLRSSICCTPLRVRKGSEEKISWAPSERGLFDVRSLYSALVRNDGIPFP